MNHLIPYRNTFLNSFVDDVEQHWQKIVENFFQPNSIGDLKNKVKNSGYPRMDVYTQDDKYIVQATVPGVHPDDVAVETYEENGCRYLRISGQMSEEYRIHGDDAAFTHKELHRRGFVRYIALPDTIKGDPEAKIRDGIVTLSWKTTKTVPRSPDIKRIELKRE